MARGYLDAVKPADTVDDDKSDAGLVTA